MSSRHAWCDKRKVYLRISKPEQDRRNKALPRRPVLSFYWHMYDHIHS